MHELVLLSLLKYHTAYFTVCKSALAHVVLSLLVVIDPLAIGLYPPENPDHRLPFCCQPLYDLVCLFVVLLTGSLFSYLVLFRSLDLQ